MCGVIMCSGRTLDRSWTIYIENGRLVRLHMFSLNRIVSSQHPIPETQIQLHQYHHARPDYHRSLDFRRIRYLDATAVQ